jgi:molecular chaperone GrpE
MAKDLINKWKNRIKMSGQKKKTEELLEEDIVNENTQAEDQENEELEEPLDEIEELRIQVNEGKDKYLRLFAEFENFKKRNIKERLDLMKTAAQGTIKDILPVLDDFDRAKAMAEDDNNSETISEGILMVYDKLYKVLAAKGLTPMESTGTQFDPELHEAISEVPAASEEQKGVIIDTVERGYYLSDKIIRFAKVVVGK